MITIKDIAREMGVSVSTVSRALQDHPDISDAKKAQIQACAMRLHYRPNMMASNLRTCRNTTIGVIIPQVNHQFFGSVLDGIEQTAGEAGYTTIICQTREDLEKEKQVIQTLMTSRVAGILMGVSKQTTSLTHIQDIISNHIPLVLYDRPCPSLRCDQVVSDDYTGSFTAVEYLIQTGCKHIAYFSAPMELEVARRRFQGYRDALQRYGITMRQEDIIFCDSRSKAIIETPLIMRRPHRPDAIFCVNDHCAAGVLYASQMLSISIPQELAICGFSDDPLCKTTSPMLTTVQQHGFTIGCKAMQRLLKRLDGDDKISQTEMVATDLIVRETTR